MSAAHIDLVDSPVEPSTAPRADAALGVVVLIDLAAVPGAFAVLVLMRPDLFLSY